MRILTFLHSFEPGGVERDALRLNAEWARLGLDVRIALGRRDGRLAEEAPDLHYTVFQKGGFSTAAFETLWMIAKLPALVRALKPDILFCAGNTYSIVAVAMRLLLGSACPRIVIRISNDLVRRDMPIPVRWLYYFWLRLQRRAFDAVVAMAAPLCAEIAEYMRPAADRLHVVENASLTQNDLDSFAAARDAAALPKHRRFLSVGRLAPQKNFALLLRAFARIAGPEDRLTIVGDGGERLSLEHLAAKLGIADQLSMPGHANPLYKAFGSATAFVLSSDYEGLPAVIMEALAAGVPIVATNCSAAMPMLLEEAGILVAANDAAALSEAMDRIGIDQVNISSMRVRAARFTEERAGREWIRLFETLASNC